jgi:hypothetical protein
MWEVVVAAAEAAVEAEDSKMQVDEGEDLACPAYSIPRTRRVVTTADAKLLHRSGERRRIGGRDLPQVPMVLMVLL